MCDIHIFFDVWHNAVFDVWHTHCLWHVTYTLSLMFSIHPVFDVQHTQCLWCVAFALSLIGGIHLLAFDKKSPARGCHCLLWAVVLVLLIQQSLSLSRNFMLYVVICLAFHSEDLRRKSAFRKISVGFFLLKAAESCISQGCFNSVFKLCMIERSVNQMKWDICQFWGPLHCLKTVLGDCYYFNIGFFDFF